MLIAQITDLHMHRAGSLLSGRIDTHPMIEKAVASLVDLDPRPDMVVVTGDLTDCGSDEEYERLKVLFARLPMPVFVIPGNHDRREAMRAAFSNQSNMPKDGPINWVAEGFPIRLIGIDSVVDGETAGALSDDTIQWLDAALAQSKKPTIIALHHPPFDVGVGYLDSVRCFGNADALADVVRPHANVERIICGHHHRPVTLNWAGTTASICPSVAHQVGFDMSPGAPVKFAMEPPAFQLHRLIDSGRIISDTIYIDQNYFSFPIALDPDYPGAHIVPAND